MNVSDLMTTVTHVCAPDDSLYTAAGILWEHDCGCLPVVDSDKKLTGIVTDRDVCIAAYARDDDMRNIPVREAMKGRPWTCTAEETLDGAASIMRQRRVRRLPVVDASGHVQGIVSLDDLARSVMTISNPLDQRALMEEVAATLAAIGKKEAESVHRRADEAGGLPA